MELSYEQDQALVKVQRWLENGDEQIFRLFGFAGTGKTTLARYFASHVEGRVLFAAFTGKAAHVLRQRSGVHATTVHQLIYNPRESSKDRIKELELKKDQWPEDQQDTEEWFALLRAIHQEKENLKRPIFALNLESELREAKLLILDECSMIDTQMADDLCYFGTKILALGDPGQLPPIRGHGFFTQGEPDFMLKEIHRQARDNPIIEISRIVRETGRLPKDGDFGNGVEITNLEKVRPELRRLVDTHDQLLVGKNSTRKAYNRRMRQLQGYEKELPQIGDRLVCLKNNHELGLLNGQIWHVETEALEEDSIINLLLVNSEDGTRQSVDIHAKPFYGGDVEWWERDDAELFDYGYALTVHKSQGSQWGGVLLFDEWYGRDRRKWLYTGITRASNNLTVVRMLGD